MNVSASQLIDLIVRSSVKVSFACLKRHFGVTQPADVKALKSLIRTLVQEGALTYTSHFGSAFIEPSNHRPQRVSKHVILKPPMCSWFGGDDQVVISLEKGASFGDGAHPTTRMAIQLLDELVCPPGRYDAGPLLSALDIGTGSGILAIVAAKLGVERVCGIDIDPCARFEARENIFLNGVADCVAISDGGLNAVGGPFDLVFANLRTPTLVELRAELNDKAADDSLLILSGMKCGECAAIEKFYQYAGFYPIKSKRKKGWRAICLARGAWLRSTGASLVSHWFGVDR